MSVLLFAIPLLFLFEVWQLVLGERYLGIRQIEGDVVEGAGVGEVVAVGTGVAVEVAVGAVVAVGSGTGVSVGVGVGEGVGSVVVS